MGLHRELRMALGMDPELLPAGSSWPGAASLQPSLPISPPCSGVRPLLPRCVCLVEKYQRVLMMFEHWRHWCFHSFPAISK